MKKNLSRELLFEIVKHILKEYRTKTAAKIASDMLITHPHLALSQSQISNTIRRMRKWFDIRIEECRANGRYDDAAKLEKRKNVTLPDKRSPLNEIAQEVVDEDIIQALMEKTLNQ